MFGKKKNFSVLFFFRWKRHRKGNAGGCPLKEVRPANAFAGRKTRVDKRQYILGKLFGDFILDIVAVVF